LLTALCQQYRDPWITDDLPERGARSDIATPYGPLPLEANVVPGGSAVGVRLVSRTGDPALQDAAASVLSQVAVVLPEALPAQLVSAHVYVSSSGAPVAEGVDLSVVRRAPGDPR
jgi:hypothetical protein